MQFVATLYTRHCYVKHIEVGSICDSVRGESYIEEALHAVHAAADGDELWNKTTTHLQLCSNVVIKHEKTL